MSSSPPADRGPAAAAHPVGRPVRSDVEAMEIALAEAVAAEAHDDVPVGAVVVLHGVVIAARHNERELTGDPTAHAEILAIRDAATAIGNWHLDDCTVYVTLEPCAMCAGALVNARAPRVVYGATDPKAGAGGSVFNVLADARLNHRCAIESGVLEEACGSILRSFFAARRGARRERSADG
ncbi:MAG: tRNA-adenosine deaminase [Ilumatobacteraceae bacterium]|nr:tRNA-adenosine deaminase [Ilumatobacteraceae bacterium]